MYDFKNPVTLLAVALVIGPMVLSADDEPETQKSPTALGDVVFSGGTQKVRIRLHVQIDGEVAQQRFAASQDQYICALFSYLDHNQNGSLSRQEAAKAPSPQMLLPAPVTRGDAEQINVAFNFGVLDDNDDSKIDKAEFQMFYRDYGDGPFRIRQMQRGGIPSAAIDLFSRLDTNSDNLLSSRELDAVASLFELDRDANEVISLGELRPVSASTTSKLAARERRKLGTDAMGFSISRGEDAAADIELHLHLTSESADRPRFKLSMNERFEEAASDARISDDGTCIVHVDDVRIQLRVVPERKRSIEQSQQTLKREFAAVGSGSDQRIRKTDRLPVYLKDLFDLLDRNSDGYVVDEELAGYTERVLPLEATAQADRLTLLVSGAGHGLFDLLDRNRDGRLGVREVREAKKTVSEFDADGDGQVSRSEIPRSFQLALVRGGLSVPYQTAHTRDAGPIWFYRMDGNHDGDLSFKEFFGSRKVFNDLDTDHDKLISIDEALQADRHYSQ